MKHKELLVFTVPVPHRYAPSAIFTPRLTALWASLSPPPPQFLSVCTYQQKMWQSFADHRDGVGFFADPLGKPSLLTYWQTLAELSYSTVFLHSKRPTGEGFSAADNSPTAAWGDDGVKVWGIIKPSLTSGCAYITFST